MSAQLPRHSSKAAWYRRAGFSEATSSSERRSALSSGALLGALSQNSGLRRGGGGLCPHVFGPESHAYHACGYAPEQGKALQQPEWPGQAAEAQFAAQVASRGGDEEALVGQHLEALRHACGILAPALDVSRPTRYGLDAPSAALP